MHGNHIPPQQLPQVHSLYKLPLAASLPLRTPAPPAAHSHWPCLTFLLYLPTSTLLLKLLLPETPPSSAAGRTCALHVSATLGASPDLTGRTSIPTA